MDLEQRLRASLVAPDPGSAFSARVMARLRRGRGRRSGRFIVVGSLLAMAAAAGMLARQFSAPAQQQADRLALSVASEPAPARLEVPSAATAEPRRVEPESPAPVAPAQAAAPVPLPVILLPARQQVQDPGLHRRSEAFHASLRDELRKVPGLALRESSQVVPEAADAGFVISVTSLATGPSPTGGEVIKSPDGASTITLARGGAAAAINADRNAGNAASFGAEALNGVVGLVLSSRRTGLDASYTLTELNAGGGATFFFSGMNGSITGVTGEGGIISISGAAEGAGAASWVEIRVSPRGSADSRYTLPVHEGDSPVQLAAALVEKLRLQVLPPDAGYAQRVLSRLATAGSDRNVLGEVMPPVLLDLLPLLETEGGRRLEQATRQALFRFVANQPVSTRVRVWQTLDRSGNPLLVAPLLDSLRQDPDRQVRLAALVNLETHHGDNAAVRSAIEGLENGEADPFVRAAVRWVLHGEKQWRNDVIAALGDPSLSYEARLAPLIAYPSVGSLQMTLVRRGLLEDEPVLHTLLALVGENLRDPGPQWATSQALRLLGTVEHPAVADLFVPLLREPSLPPDVTNVVRSWAMNNMTEPSVREAMPLLNEVVPSALLERMNELSGPGGGVVEIAPAP